MATVRKIVREKKLARIDDSKKRSALKEIIASADSDANQVRDAMLKMQDLARNGSKTRCRNRCGQCGRPHGVYRYFKLCRLCLREAVSKGFVPFVKKSSW